jgi:PEP-CTERM motif
MKTKSPKVFAAVLMFGLLLCASSTAYADAFSLTTFSFNNFQFTPSAGSAQLTLTSATARADAGIQGGPVVSNISNSFPFAQATAIVNGITATAIADANTNSLSATTTAFLGGCTCQGGSGAFTMLNGTLILSGAEGPVDVSISALRSFLWQVQTDAFGRYAESGLFMDVLVNGTPVFSLQVEALHPLLGPNQASMIQAAQQISRNITLQGGSTNSISVRLTSTSLVINEVPEPASVVLLMSGLGALTGVLKKRRKASSE